MRVSLLRLFFAGAPLEINLFIEWDDVGALVVDGCNGAVDKYTAIPQIAPGGDGKGGLALFAVQQLCFLPVQLGGAVCGHKA